MKKFRPIAVHLPQFHPIPENDEWWGKGFTEWTNVAKATPKFKNHYQPHLPSDLGFYDLRLEEARLEQEKLAKEYGIYGFCYYHYWFNGKTLLHEPIERKLNNAKEDFPFMLCWANENWTRVWDGGHRNVLMEQQYSNEDHVEHLKYLIPFFKDKRYITIDGKAVFAVYRSTKIPDFEEVCKLWKNEAAKEGVELYIIRFESFGEKIKNIEEGTFDAAAEFQPHVGVNIFNGMKPNNPQLQKAHKTLRDEITVQTFLSSIRYRLNKFRRKNQKSKQEKPKTKIIEYSDFVDKCLAYDEQNVNDYKIYSCVSPGFDNSARRKEGALVIHNSTPQIFGRWISEKLISTPTYSSEENLFFINAWNEWAEGNHLEPDQKWGRQYLEALKKAFADYI